ncbi:cyclic pyranopterin monophosphate synthase MoaC [Pyruvatibacter sp.]|uniref:cyclic pyranopterin monophosphate synthase MoaC n=1 Tax=Pyruvatibacter sp. TaxID=1981328 RepID=UPI0032EDE7C8
MTKDGLTHLDARGNAAMVDVSDKAVTTRDATAEGRITMSAQAFASLVDGTAPKGDVIAAARIAGIMAAKRTSDLIPLCHPLPIAKVAIEFEPDAATSSVAVTAHVRTTAQTGVEMEALTATSVACLTLYDMLKAMDKTMVISNIRVLTKRGGKSGDYSAT